MIHELAVNYKTQLTAIKIQCLNTYEKDHRANTLANKELIKSQSHQVHLIKACKSLKRDSLMLFFFKKMVFLIEKFHWDKLSGMIRYEWNRPQIYLASTLIKWKGKMKRFWPLGQYQLSKLTKIWIERIYKLSIPRG